MCQTIRSNAAFIYQAHVRLIYSHRLARHVPSYQRNLHDTKHNRSSPKKHPASESEPDQSCSSGWHGC